MFCKKCGKELKEGAKFCVSCGNPVGVVKPTVNQPTTNQVVNRPTQDISMMGRQVSMTAEPAKPKKKKNVGLVVLIVLILLLLVLGGVGGFVLFQTLNEESVTYDEKEDDEKKSDSDKKEEKLEEISTEDEESTEELSGAKESTEEVEQDDSQEVSAATERTETDDVVQNNVTGKEFDTSLIGAGNQEMENPLEIHSYYIMLEDVTWIQALTRAAAYGGYLVNINSEEEFQTIINKIYQENAESYRFWIGACRENDSREYYWVNSEGNPVGECINNNSHWLPGEPSCIDSGTSEKEHYVDLIKHGEEWVYNDVPNDLIQADSSYEGKIGYIIEIEE